MKLFKLTLIAITLLIGPSIFGQITCDSIGNVTNSYLNTSQDKQLNRIFISDGQVYRAFLDEDQSTEFEVTLYGGSTYRVAASAGVAENYLIFEIYDKSPERNLLFSNMDYNNAPYWDFKIESTIDCYVEARLDMNKKLSGCAIMMIGFEKRK
jgi:dihydrofolate reductase